MFDSVYTRISDIVDVHIPLTQLSKRKLRMKSKPWITPALRVSIYHNILIEKLDYYGICGVTKDWFTSYLTNRYQYVSLGQTESELQSVSCGVPQGSGFGPLLFLIYINDFSNCSEILDFHLFADDANLFYKHKHLKVLESKVNNELVNIHTWLSANKLSLKGAQSRYFELF